MCILSITMFWYVPKAFARVVLSEFFPNPVGSDETGEWIELYNPDDVDISLEGYQLEDVFGATSSYTFTQESSIHSIASKSYIVLHKTDTHISLNNDKEQIKLLYPEGDFIVSSIYDPVIEGKTLSLISGKWEVTNPTQATANVQSETPTPSPTQSSLLVTSPFPSPTVYRETVTQPTSLPIISSTQTSTQKPQSQKNVVSTTSVDSSKSATPSTYIPVSTIPVRISSSTGGKSGSSTTENICENKQPQRSIPQYFSLVICLCILLILIYLYTLEWYNVTHEECIHPNTKKIPSSYLVDDNHFPSIITK